MKKLSLLIPVLLLFLAACIKLKPLEPTMFNNYTNLTQAGNNGMIPIPAGASGALYAENSILLNGTNPGYFNTGGYANAWFLNDSITKNAGIVIAGNDTLHGGYYDDSIIFLPWYTNNIGGVGFNGPTPPLFPSNAIAWQVQGNATSGVPAFNYTDNTPFPLLTGLSLPASINIDKGLTIHYNITGAYDAIFYILNPGINFFNFGGGDSTGIFSGGSDTSASFSTAQLYQCSTSGGSLVVEVMLAKLTPYTIGNQTFYFVKTSVYGASTMVQQYQ